MTGTAVTAPKAWKTAGAALRWGGAPGRGTGGNLGAVVQAQGQWSGGLHLGAQMLVGDGVIRGLAGLDIQDGAIT